MKKIVYKAKKVKKNYDKPTPKFWRRVGDGCLTIGSALTAIGVYNGVNSYVAIVGIIITALGKLATNLAS